MKAELTFSEEFCEGEGKPVWFLTPLSPYNLSSKLHSAQQGSAGLMGAMGRVLEANAGAAKAPEVFPGAEKESDNTQLMGEMVCRS